MAYTIYQRLNKVLGSAPTVYQVDPASFSNLSPQEMLDKKLEAQQMLYTQGQYTKVSNSLKLTTNLFESTRMMAHIDYELMEYFPEINRALHVFANESTTINDRGNILEIYSESERIKEELHKLFFKILRVNTNLTSWSRNLCKYGEVFLNINAIPKKGITDARVLPTLEITREEAGFNRYNSGENLEGVKFFWKAQNAEFTTFEIAHFRLITDDKKLPYGTSMLEGIRRIWKQLYMAEDAMLVYRLSRAAERRVHKIYVGNMDDKDIPQYIEAAANKIKRSTVIDSANGNQNSRYNVMAVDEDYFVGVRSENASNPIETLAGACLSLDTKIPLLNGKTLTLNEIIHNWDDGDRDMWIYSCNPITGEITPAPITWAGVTRKNTQVLKITLDNGEEIITTPDHKFVHKTNGFVNAENLIVGDSLMPFYTRVQKIKTNNRNGYHQVWDNKNNKWVFTHRLVKEKLFTHDLIKYGIFNIEKYLDNDKKYVIHHKDYDRFNNNPNNLVLMNTDDHLELHQDVIKDVMWGNPELNKKKISDGVTRYIHSLTDDEKKERYSKNIHLESSVIKAAKKLTAWSLIPENRLRMVEGQVKTKSTKEFKDKFSQITKDLWKKPNHHEKVFTKEQKLQISDGQYEKIVNLVKELKHLKYALEVVNNDAEFIREFKENNKDIRSSIVQLNYLTRTQFSKFLKYYKGFNSLKEWKKTLFDNHNHKITKIEWLEDFIDTGTITVDGNEIFTNNHTFALASGIFVKNSNLGDIHDIQYFQNKMLCALGIPKAFIGFDETTGEGKNLAIMDVRFARDVNKIQQSLIMELNKIAIIHLYMLGFENDLDNFTISLNNPSTQAKMLEVENLKSKADLFAQVTGKDEKGLQPWSRTKALKEIFGMSEQEIRLDLQQQVVENAAADEMGAIAEVIVQTGIYSDLYKAYNIDPDALFKETEIVGNDENGDPIDSAGGTPFTSMPSSGGGNIPDIATDFSKDGDEGPQLDGEPPLEGGPDLGGEPPLEGGPELEDTTEIEDEPTPLAEIKRSLGKLID